VEKRYGREIPASRGDINVAGYVSVAKIEDVPVGSLCEVEVDGKDIVLANVNGKVFAFGGACTHRGGPLAEGELTGDVVTCPLHGGQFSVETGQAVGPPPTTSIPTYPTKVDGDSIRVAITE
jgi:nitrite reductase/ring-hydroxylating ferredoxin subunit